MTPEIALFPQQASTAAHNVDMLLYFLLAVCGSMGLLVAGLLIFFCIRYRRRPGDVGPPAETIPSRALEWFWTISPLGIFVIMFFWGAAVYLDVFHAPDDATPVYTVAKQWMWKFQHPEGQREINTLHVPIGRPIKLLMTSEDVIHSFFVPAFRIHMDVLPDRYTSVWFEPSRAGEFHLFCSQYCGTNHAGMIGKVVVMEAADYQRWLEYGAEGSLALEGRKTFLKYRCISCHSADENARAPVLEALYHKQINLADGSRALADEDYFRDSILYPGKQIVAGYQNIMPTFKGQISEDEMVTLVAFLKSLAPGGTPRRVEDYPPPAATPDINTESSPP